MQQLPWIPSPVLLLLSLSFCLFPVIHFFLIYLTTLYLVIVQTGFIHTCQVYSLLSHSGKRPYFSPSWYSSPSSNEVSDLIQHIWRILHSEWAQIKLLHLLMTQTLLPQPEELNWSALLLYTANHTWCSLVLRLIELWRSELSTHTGVANCRVRDSWMFGACSLWQGWDLERGGTSDRYTVTEPTLQSNHFLWDSWSLLPGDQLQFCDILSPPSMEARQP